MGKLKALRMGITKGLQHNPLKVIDPRFLAQERIAAKLICTQCKHASNSHKRTRPPYQGTEGRTLYDMILETGSKGSGGFAECIFYFCDECESMGGVKIE